MLRGLPLLNEKTNVGVVGYSFSEPQTGKGPADRGASYLKHRVYEYVNFGQNRKVTNVNELMIAFEGDVKNANGVSFFNCKFNSSSLGKAKFDGITKLSEVQYDGRDLIAWKFGGIGDGKRFKNFGTLKELPELTEVDRYISPNPFPTANQFNGIVEELTEDDDEIDEENDLEPEQNDDDASPMICAKCSKKYRNRASFLKHCENCQDVSKRTLRDFVLSTYKSSIDSSSYLTTQQDVFEAESIEVTESNLLPEGWALVGAKKRSTFSVKQKKFLLKLYQQGESNPSNKITPDRAASLMKSETDSNSQPYFKHDEYLTGQQIRGIFKQFKGTF